jgi:hypothetical protein
LCPLNGQVLASLDFLFAGVLRPFSLIPDLFLWVFVLSIPDSCLRPLLFFVAVSYAVLLQSNESLLRASDLFALFVLFGTVFLTFVCRLMFFDELEHVPGGFLQAL